MRTRALVIIASSDIVSSVRRGEAVSAFLADSDVPRRASPRGRPELVCEATVPRTAKPATCHTCRHSLATHLLDAAHDIRTVRELLDHRDVSTTVISTHLLHRGPGEVQSPADQLLDR